MIVTQKYSDAFWNDVDKIIEHIPSLTTLFGKNILITGSNGMICSAIADTIFRLNVTKNAGIAILLAGRSRQRIAERFYCFEEGRDYRFLPFDATTEHTMSFDSVDFIIHGAGNANPAMFSSNPVETMMVHFLGTQAMLSLADQKKAKRILYISSSEVYGIRKDNAGLYSEGDFGFLDIQNPRACYPSVKRAAETLCAAHKAQYGTNYVVVRPGHIYGPALTMGDDRAFAQFVRKALNGNDIIMKSAGLQMRSYCYSLDCASAILTTLLNGESGEAYNISNAVSVVTIRQMAEVLAEVCGVRVVFARATDKELSGYNLMDYSGLASSKLESLGWSACFDIRAGIESCLRAMKVQDE